MADNKNPPFIALKFELDKTLTCMTKFKIFSKKVKFAFDGQFKDSDNKVKVSCILNWLGDEAFLIYDNFNFYWTSTQGIGLTRYLMPSQTISS